MRKTSDADNCVSPLVLDGNLRHTLTKSARRRYLRKNCNPFTIPPTSITHVCAYPERSGGYGHFYTARMSVPRAPVGIDVALKVARRKETLPYLHHEALVYKKLNDSIYTPAYYGEVKNHPNLPPGIALVTELLPIPLSKLWSGQSCSCPINTVNCYSQPAAAGPLLHFILSSFPAFTFISRIIEVSIFT